MNTDTVQRWLDDYIEAWNSNDSEVIAALFAEDATYRYHPWDEPLRGRDAIVANWLEAPDEPGTWEASYRPLIVDGDQAVTVGETRYKSGDVFANIWELRFDANGRCADFVEWFMKVPGQADQGNAGDTAM